MKVLVFGGREYDDEAAVFDALDRLHRKRGITCIIHGATPTGRGADWMADAWAKANRIPVDPYPVRPELDGPWPGAGPIRNLRMLTASEPDGAVQFPGDRGTRSMRRFCDTRRPKPLPVWEPVPAKEETTP